MRPSNAKGSAVFKASTVWRRRTRWATGTLVAIASIIVIGWVLFILVADWIATHDVGNVTGPLRVSRLQTARDAARGRLLTLGAGAFAAGALIFTAQNFILSRRTFELSEQGQVTDRYTKAIEQLGSDKVDVRIGGIYALERIALDSGRDYPTVIKVLAAFIREHSREQLLLSEPDIEPPEHVIRPDVQAAVIVNGDKGNGRDRINLTSVNLAGADLLAADLRHVNLAGADLSGAKLTAAKLFDVNLTGADLSGADLADTNLVGADLTYADLTYAQLARADISRAVLSHTGSQSRRPYWNDPRGCRVAGRDPFQSHLDRREPG